MRFFLFLALLTTTLYADTSLPTAYQGRIRPIEASARLWLHDLYHKQQLKKEDLSPFQTHSRAATDLFWNQNIPIDAPLFWIHHAQTKELLHLPTKEDRFSYSELKEAFPSAYGLLATHQFVETYRNPTNRMGTTRLELSALAPGLWIALQGDNLVVLESPWQSLKPGQIIATKLTERLRQRHQPDKAAVDELLALWNNLQNFERKQDSNLAIAEAVQTLRQQGMKPFDIAQTLERQWPLRVRLSQAALQPKVLPGRLIPGEWYTLKALAIEVYDPVSDSLVPVGNFTVYPDAVFNELRQSSDSSETLATLQHAYSQIEGTYLREGGGKTLFYPTHAQLAAEMWYYQLPLTTVDLTLYFAATLLFGLAISLHSRSLRISAWATLAVAWILHTTILILRCYILGRPPVTNMFETVVYVPWIAVTLSVPLCAKLRSLFIPFAASLLAAALLALLEVTQLHHGLDTVQPVLDSQYWLIIHVLLVVASYGVFLLCGVLGHLYLAMSAFSPKSTSLPQLSRGILHAMYMGTAMLIAGTILGGVWAAESWGRFWDWDPKESWAFISSCCYLICIHAYTFRYIDKIGLAVGAIVGLWAISFTWYGVNYILGTGLHSYGFGSGGEGYYYSFLLAEMLFIIFCLWMMRFKQSKSISIVLKKKE